LSQYLSFVSGTYCPGSSSAGLRPNKGLLCSNGGSRARRPCLHFTRGSYCVSPYCSKNIPDILRPIQEVLPSHPNGGRSPCGRASGGVRYVCGAYVPSLYAFLLYLNFIIFNKIKIMFCQVDYDVIHGSIFNSF